MVPVNAAPSRRPCSPPPRHVHAAAARLGSPRERALGHGGVVGDDHVDPRAPRVPDGGGLVERVGHHAQALVVGVAHRVRGGRPGQPDRVGAGHSARSTASVLVARRDQQRPADPGRSRPITARSRGPEGLHRQPVARSARRAGPRRAVRPSRPSASNPGSPAGS